MNDENWQDDDSATTLSPELARRYGEAGSIFLCRVKNSPVLEARINKISPNGIFAKVELHGPGGEQQVWMPIEDCRVLDVLIPFVTKEDVEKAQAEVLEKMEVGGGAAEKLMQAIFGPTPKPTRPTRKPKKKNEEDDEQQK